MLAWLQTLLGADDSGATLTIAGTLSDGATEQEVFRGFEDLILTLDGATWATGTDFNSARQGIINGITSAQNELAGWNNEVRDKLSVAAVVRGSDATIFIFFPAFSGYDISALETITVTVPASAHSGDTALIASTTFAITPATLAGNVTTNADAQIELESRYTICDRSGFKQLPYIDSASKLRTEWTGLGVRTDSLDPRHPQELLGSKQDRQVGAQNPEAQANKFISTDVSVDDL